MRLDKIGILIFFILVLSISAFAAPPFLIGTTSNTGVTINFPNAYYIQLNSSIVYLRWWTYNSTDGLLLNNTRLNCTIDIMDKNGKSIVMNNSIQGGVNYGTSICANCWNINITTTTANAPFAASGVYPYQIRCSGSGVGGFIGNEFLVTPTGYSLSDGEGSEYLAQSLMMLLFMLATIFFLVWIARKDNLPFLNEPIRIVLIVSAFIMLIGLMGMIIHSIGDSNLPLSNFVTKVSFMSGIYVAMIILGMCLVFWYFYGFIVQTIQSLAMKKNREGKE